MKSFAYHSLSLTIASCLLTACATTSQVTPSNSAQDNAKEMLGQAVKSQLRSSFSYETSVHVSNDIRRQNLANATPEQLSAKPLSEQCESAHDTAYVAFLKKVEAENSAVADEKYDQARAQMKSDFLACRAEREKKQGYQPFDFDAFYEQIKTVSSPEQEQMFAKAVEQHIANQPAQEHIDTKHTALDVKKAELMHEYLIRPSSIRMTGSYQPLQGKITALPALDYTAKNLKIAVNQPIYVDLKTGGIYLWADNFALLNSQLLDVKLGDDWHNKWLYLPINDGSLPNEFTQDLIKAYIKAKQESFMALPKDGFTNVNADSITTLPFISANLPDDKINLIQNTPIIVKNNVDEKSREYSNYVFADTLFQEMASKYPVLTLQLPDFYEREIIDGESVIHVVNADSNTGAPSEDGLEEKIPTINSELLMRALFLYLQRQVDDYYMKLNSQETESAQSSHSDNPYTPATHYGITHGKLSWVHQRYYVGNKPNEPLLEKAGVLQSEPVLVDIFTQIFQNSKQMGEFNRLPTAHQTPTPENSINLFTYQDALRARFKETGEYPPIIEQYLRYSSLGGESYGDVEAAPAEASPAETEPK